MNLSLFTLLTGIMLESGLRHRRESYEVALRNFRSEPAEKPDLELLAGRRDAGRS
jgi:hypothetical protein